MADTQTNPIFCQVRWCSDYLSKKKIHSNRSSKAASGLAWPTKIQPAWNRGTSVEGSTNSFLVFPQTQQSRNFAHQRWLRLWGRIQMERCRWRRLHKCFWDESAPLSAPKKKQKLFCSSLWKPQTNGWIVKWYQLSTTITIVFPHLGGKLFVCGPRTP